MYDMKQSTVWDQIPDFVQQGSQPLWEYLGVYENTIDMFQEFNQSDIWISKLNNVGVKSISFSPLAFGFWTWVALAVFNSWKK